MMENVGYCLPVILQYSIIPDQNIQLQNSTSSSNVSVTILSTMLNDTRFTSADSSPQVLLLNQTTNGTYYLNHGAWPPVQVYTNETFQSSNGVAYLVDGILFPPLNLTDSAKMKNLTKFVQALEQSVDNSTLGASIGGSQNETSSSSNSTSVLSINGIPIKNVTVFAPVNEAITGNSFNVSSYIFSGVLYNNSTTSGTKNLTDLNGNSVVVNMTGNCSMQVGNASVIESNILIKECVLHIINGTISTDSTSKVEYFVL
jgi:uncharacterized surface protein with fasciclin (FAS1) repeats